MATLTTFARVFLGVVIVCLPGWVQGRYPCENDWHPKGYLCYRHFPEIKTFAEAVVACAKLGAKLPYPVDATEDAFLNHIATFTAERGDVWVAMGSMRERGHWTLFYTGESLKNRYTNWAEGEPRNLLGDGCVAKTVHAHWKFQERLCHLRIYYICVKPALP